MKDRLQRPCVWGKSGVSQVEEVGAGRSPGPAEKLDGTSERDGQPGGTGRLCPRRDAPRMKPVSAGQRTDTGQSPSAAPVGENHSLKTSTGGRRVAKEMQFQCWVQLHWVYPTPTDVWVFPLFVTYLLFECSSGHSWENLHSNGAGRRRVLNNNCQAARHKL